MFLDESEEVAAADSAEVAPELDAVVEVPADAEAPIEEVV